MKTNIGSGDAALRFLIGWVLLFLGPHGLGWWALIGLWPLLTMVIGFCPVYALFHLNTAAWEDAYELRHRPPHHDPPEHDGAA